MKTRNLFNKNCLVSFYSGFILFSLTACNELYQEETVNVDSSNEEFVQLNHVLSHLEYGSDIIIVQKGTSIQEAVNAAHPGDMIFIEPGIYKEAITVNKPNLKLVGACSTSDEQVILENPGNEPFAVSLINESAYVSVSNIQFVNYGEESTQVKQLKCAGRGTRKILYNITREELGNGVAHYKYDVQMGPGEFDRVRIHRVVKEYRPYHPVRTQGDVFMVHGAPQDFEDIFLIGGAEVINASTSAPYYMAEKNIDVWGIDLAWNFIPAETEDLSFMQGWGFEKDIDHTLVAMALSRLIRGLTGQGFDRMNLLGFSYGVPVAYGAAGRETRLHPLLKQIKGIIPVDSHLKIDQSKYDELHTIECASAAEFKAGLDAGVYYSDWGKLLIMLADLALTAPDDPSPIPDFEGLTNSQAMILIGIAENDGYWHFFGGDMETLTFHFTDADRFFRAVANMAPYMPLQSLYEIYACSCNEEDVSFDDHLGDINIPILNLISRGGEGNIGLYTPTQTSSTDITNEIISVDGYDRTQDYGHADLWFGDDADKLVWEKLVDWLTSHAKR
jgi:hypothetical protein